MESRSEPTIIQGGMGAAVSAWQLAKAVARTGQLGVVSGTALDSIMVRRLQLGDIGGHIRRALAEFPLPGMAERIVDRFFVEGGKPSDKPFSLPSNSSTNRRRKIEKNFSLFRTSLKSSWPKKTITAWSA